MIHESFFRVLCAIFFFGGIATRAYFQLRANAATGRIPLTKEPALQLIGLRAAGLVFLGSALVYVFHPSSVAWSRVSMPVSVRLSGAGLSAAAWVLLVWTFRSLGNNLTPTVATKEAHTLVTTGPYRFIRHPFYLAASIYWLGIALVAASWFMLAGIALFCVLLIPRVRAEESRLLEKFGESYRDYLERTGRFIPRLAART